MNASQCTFCTLSFVCTVRTAFVVHVKWQLQKWQAVKSWISRIVVPLFVEFILSLFLSFEKKNKIRIDVYVKSSLRTISGAHTRFVTLDKKVQQNRKPFSHTCTQLRTMAVECGSGNNVKLFPFSVNDATSM